MTTLDALVQGELHDGLPLAADDPRIVDKATRDRLVIFAPSCSPLLRPALAAEDVQRWQHLPPSRFLIAIPRGWSRAAFGAGAEDALFVALEARFPLLAKQLLLHRSSIQAAPHGEYWWELPPYPVDFFTNQTIVWAHNQPLCAAPTLDGAYLLAGISFTTAPTAFLLGALNSKQVREAAAQLPNLSAAQITTLPIAEPAPAAQQRIGELAEQAVTQARTRLVIDRQFSIRVLRDLAPAGAIAGPRLAEWWQLSFEDFLVELAHRFKSDVPFRYRDGWRDHLRDQRVARQVCDAAIARAEDEIDTLMQGSL